ECIRKLTDSGVPVVMLTGNHDIPNVAGRAHAMEIYYTLGIQNIQIISKPDVLQIETRGGTAQVAGLPYLVRSKALAREEWQGKSTEEVRKAIESQYEKYLEDLAGRCDSSLPTVMMGHFWVRDARLNSWQQSYFNPTEPKVSISWLKNNAFDYVA